MPYVKDIISDTQIFTMTEIKHIYFSTDIQDLSAWMPLNIILRMQYQCVLSITLILS